MTKKIEDDGSVAYVCTDDDCGFTVMCDFETALMINTETCPEGHRLKRVAIDELPD